MIVVDTNVLAYLLLPYEFSAAADALFERDPDWAAPILWRSEFRNLLAGELRRKNLSFDEIVKVQGEAEALLAGHSAGAAAVGAVRVAHELSERGEPGVVVTLFPDRADRYLPAP